MIENELQGYRKQIDKIDEEIIELLAKRFETVTKIGKFKKENNLSIIDNNRFQKVLDKVKNIASKHGISVSLIQDMYNLIHKYSCELEQ